MRPPIRVMIVDDSSLVRKILSDQLAADPDLEVVATASNGRLALGKVAAVRPDVVLLDQEMPELDGLSTLKVLQRDYPQIAVIMVSRFTKPGAEVTIDCLLAGARDFVAKPEADRDLEQCIRQELIPKIKAQAGPAGKGQPVLLRSHPPLGRESAPREMATRPDAGSTDSQLLPPSFEAAAPAARPSTRPASLLVIGASTGGPPALQTVLAGLPRSCGVPILIVQHMPPVFTGYLADRLRSTTGLAVAEAVDNSLLGADRVWIAPGDFHLVLARQQGSLVLRLHQGALINECRPSVDVLLESAVQECGSGVLAVILTGMGRDGLAGCARVRAAGGQVVVQDESSSVVWGMPGHVARAGLADAVLPLDQIAAAIARRCPVREG